MWDDIKEIQSKDANVKKYVFSKEGLSGGAAVAESVLYKYPDYNSRTVICCSTQSGCPVGCRFCGAGDYFVRSLSSDEITSQPVHLLESNNIDADQVRRMQIMFMSMGEPLLNLKNLAISLVDLYAMYPKAALLISTIGPDINYADLYAVSREIETIGLQFSVHESTDEARDKLIPFKKKLTLSEIANRGRAWASVTGRRPFFNYCVHDKNNSWDDVNRLMNLFDPQIWEATISVICERDESIAAANARQRQLASDFMEMMVKEGFSTRMFDPAGQDDIGGGCGQLWFVQKWMQAHPDMARPSVGHGLEAVHTPR